MNLYLIKFLGLLIYLNLTTLLIEKFFLYFIKIKVTYKRVVCLLVNLKLKIHIFVTYLKVLFDIDVST